MLKFKPTACGLLAAAAMIALAASPALAQELKVSVDSFSRVKMIPDRYAFCNAAKEGHTKPGADVSPRISWSRGPAGTKSYAIIALDTDVPSIRTDMNQEGKTVSATVPRVTFYHWVLVDIPAKVRHLSTGEDSSARTVGGKPQSPSKVGLRGLNNYTIVFASNEKMKGQYYGYDGPCPPWNDEIPHHYHFTVYALSVDSLGLSGPFTGPDALKAMEGKVLAKGEAVAVYAQNPAVIAELKKKK